jgi:hypothetical protein
MSFELSGLVANEESCHHIPCLPQKEVGDEADEIVTGATEDEIRRIVQEREPECGIARSR